MTTQLSSSCRIYIAFAVGAVLLTVYITLGNIMDCMLVPHRNSYIEALITHVMVFGDVSLGGN